MYRGSGKLKRKPMLLKKYLEYTRLREKRTIGIIGVNRGAGATYTGMLLAFYYGTEKRVKTAFLECNNHGDFKRIQDAFEWSREDERTFSLDRITFFKEVASNEIPEIFSDDYGCYIMDFGTDCESWKAEFKRCGIKIIVGDRALWNQSKTVELVKSLENVRGSDNWTYIIPYANKKMLKQASKKTGKKFIAIPYETDCTLLSKETIKLFDRLFG